MIVDAGGTASFAPACGFTADLIYPSNNAPGGTTASLLVQVPKPGAALPIPSGGTYVANFEVSLSNDVTFNAGLGGDVTLPAGLSTTGRTFYFNSCAPVTPTGCTGTATTHGPLTPSGQTFSFTGGSNPFTALSNEVFESQFWYFTK